MSTFTHEGHNVHYITAGDPSRPPVILVHGWNSHLDLWKSTLDVLKDDYYCVALDLLGFGDSDKPRDADYGIDAHSRRVLALADSLGLERFILIGHSMGGMIALHIAANLAPERVIKLVNVDGTLGGKLTPLMEFSVIPTVFLYRWLPFIVPLLRVSSRVPVIGRRMFRMLFYDMNIVPFSAWEPLRERSFQPGCVIPSYEAGRAIRQGNLVPDLHRITAPTLTIFGTEDGTVPLAHGQLAAQHIPNHQLNVLEHCGHHPMIEKPDTYVQILTDFLAAQ